MSDLPARPPTPLKYLMWDGTDPVDSVRLAKGLANTFRCVNLLDASPATEFGVLGSPRVFQPCGSKGKDHTDALWLRGMFEFPRTFFHPTHGNSTGELPSILQYSGHGIPGFMFAESGILIAMSRAMNRLPTATGTHYELVDDNWDDPKIKVVIFSACRQLAGKVQQFNWATRMRGGTNRVHTILGYRNTAPAAATSAAINAAFVGGLAAGQTFRDAWRAAHGGDLRMRWAALAYQSSVDDRMKSWVRDGALPKEPAAGESILYFDEGNLAGQVVTQPSPDFSMGMRFESAPTATLPGLSNGDMIPPWSVLRPDTLVSLRLKFNTDTFNTGDKLWIGALQVRPDYGGPFEIENLIQPAAYDTLPASVVVPRGRLHDASSGWAPDTYSDLFEFAVDRNAMTWATLTSDYKGLTIPMRIIGLPNGHLPVFYLMVRVERGNREFGIPTDTVKGLHVANQARLIDEPQFCVFLIHA